MDKTKIIILAILGGIVILVLIFVFGFLLNKKPDPDSIYNTKTQLNFWVVSDVEPAYETAINKFNQTYPNITITYRRFDNVKDYERILLNALASGQGPDIFVIRNSDISRKSNKIFPVPISQYSIRNLRNDFPEIVEKDFYSNNKIYALPTFIDTLVMIYNKDLFNEAALVYPANTWEEFGQQIKVLTKFDDETGKISQAGAAIGGSQNIKNSEDLLSLLMIQSGAEMIDSNSRTASFLPQGRKALEFYIQFSNPNLDFYTWDDYLPQDFESFAREKSVIVFGYSSDLKDIKNRNLFINSQIAKIPQIKGDREAAIADYFGYTVSRQARYPTIAWDFVKILTLDSDIVENYLQITERPPALKSLIQRYKNNEEFGVFVKQALIAKSWSKPDPEKIDSIFDQMIYAVRNREIKISDAIQNAENEVSNLIKGF